MIVKKWNSHEMVILKGSRMHDVNVRYGGHSIKFASAPDTILNQIDVPFSHASKPLNSEFSL
jgi:hypothetical protein